MAYSLGLLVLDYPGFFRRRSMRNATAAAPTIAAPESPRTSAALLPGAAVTRTGFEVVAVWAIESLVVNVTVNVPAFAYTWLGFSPLPLGVPSPQSQLYVYGPAPPLGFAVNVIV